MNSKRRRRSHPVRSREVSSRAGDQATGLATSAIERTSGSMASGIGRWELALVLLICLIGVSTRLAFPSRMSVEHFDEGVYASNIWFGQDSGFQYRLRQLYAPPLLPGLIECCAIAELLLLGTTQGPSDFAVMLPSLLAGCSTVIIVWRIARSWFGPRAGMVSALLVATSDFQSVYSRAALTDVLLVFLLSLAVWLIGQACRNGRLGTIVAAGVVAGLAWWAKYNGWLALAISFCGILALAATDPKQRRDAPRYLARWLVIALIAGILWSPVLYSLQSIGGYEVVAANHRTYVVGIEGWGPSFVRQFRNLRYFDGVFGALGLTAATLLVSSLGGGTSRIRTVTEPWRLRRPPVAHLTLAVALGALALSCSLSAVLFALSAIGLMGRLFALRVHSEGQPTNSPLGFWFLTTWLVSLSLVTPLYHPYPRLVLPWIAATWIGASLGLDELLYRLDTTRWRESLPLLTTGRRTAITWICLVCCMLLLAVQVPRITSAAFPAWQSRTGLKSIATDLAAKARELARSSNLAADEVVVFVYGEPALFYHLRREGLPLVGPVQSPQAAVEGQRETKCPVLLVTGPNAHHSSEFAAQWAAADESFQMLARYTYRPSDLVLLNLYDPGDLQRAQAHDEEVRLYRVRMGR